MKFDLHSHTKVSFCGKDDPAALISKMIEEGISVFGICDHNYAIPDKRAYYESIKALAERFRDKILIYAGIEIATQPELRLKEDEDVSFFDYCLVEHLDQPASVAGGDILAYADKLGCPTGIAHTDLFAFAEQKKGGAESFFRLLAEKGIFWELNVNYDSIHGYREWAYVKEFMTNPAQQKTVRDAGLALSVGFDGHRMEDYDAARVERASAFLLGNGFRLPAFCESEILRRNANRA